jgi:hypothetical protein
MLRAALIALTFSFATLTHGADAVVDNDRVIVWDTSNALPAAKHDFVAVPLSRPGTAIFGHRGEVPSKNGIRTIVIELKENAPATIPNRSGYPLAFPRPHATKLFENDRVVAWDVAWQSGEPTPMHFHDKDAVAVFEATGALQSKTPDGNSEVSATKFAEVLFAPRDRTHAEMLARGQARAIIIELK